MEEPRPDVERKVDCGGVALNVAEFGAGPPLVLLHGVQRCWRDWSPLIPALSRWHRVLALDMRGHGESGRCGGRYHVTDYVGDVAGFVRRLESPAILLGHSLGAMVAAGAAAEAPDCVAGAILEDPPFCTLGADIRRTPYHALFTGVCQVLDCGPPDPDRIERGLAEIRMPTPDMAGTVRFGDVREPAAVRFLAECLTRMDRFVLDPLVDGRWLDGYDMERTLRRIDCPVLLVQGEWSRGGMLPDATAERAVGLLRRGRRVSIKGVGHQIHGTQPQKMLSVIEGFLAGCALKRE